MTKLQKQPPPAYPGSGRSTSTTTTSTAPLQGAVPYENLPQSTQQPVPVMTAVTPSSYNDLPSTNPFSPNFTPPSAALNADQQSPFSPVSPLIETPSVQRRSEASIVAPTPQRPDANQRRSVDLRRLDGKPYSGSTPVERHAKPVRVARDMHDGALPPVYKRRDSDLVKPAEGAQGSACRHCGKKCAEGQECSHCGKRKASLPKANSTTPPVSQHTRTTSEGVNSHRSRISETTTAGPSSSPGSSPGRKSCCNKCGRYKRPGSIDASNPSHAHAATEPMPMASHPALRVHQAGLSVQPGMSGLRSSVYPQIDVIPPSTTSYKPTTQFPPSIYGDESPLVGRDVPPEAKPSRHSSLIRSLSRRLSRRDKKKEKATPPGSPLPSQQVAAGETQSGEQSAGRLINMISAAMQGPLAGTERDTQYSRLTPDEQPDRPTTPFSFVGGKDEEEVFEMVHVRDRESLSDSDSWKEGANEQITITRPDSGVIPQDTIDVIPRPKSAEPFSQHLAVPEAERPQITRFKSLRSGVSRMNSNISRSTSLKRLGSLKTAHHAWYRDDMAIEGAMGNEHAVPAF
ncbi:hypothetical protein PV08_08640 [Exophiala spinifera]|uniref:Uncharacterized protein n=1 Tax=Exophiala spinifera TaxID=91928 RepID=A0A0D1ZKV3_9EURO|nr:uncharacterized protein PV08_08640 [Exophiala spinifera]KIW13452.1 hypothetical protein PV08_08640 [Exophiala spinifera]